MSGRTTCKGRTKTGDMCRNPPLAGKRYCARHIKARLGKTPQARARQLENLQAGRNGHNQHTRGAIAVEPVALQQRVEEILSEVGDADGPAARMFRRSATKLGSVQIELEELIARGKMDRRMERRREVLERQELQLLQSLGLTPSGRASLGKLEDRQRAANREGAVPVRDNRERNLAVLWQLLVGGALPGVAGARLAECARELERDGIDGFSTPEFDTEEE